MATTTPSRAAAGADTLNGGSDSDTYLFAAGDVVSGESIADTGASGTDTISVSGTNDFTLATMSGIEALKFTAGATTTFNSNQLPTNLAVTGSAGTNNIIVNMSAAGTFTIAGWSFASWTAGIDTVTINGTSGADTITGGSGAETITGGGGADIINGGDGADTITGGLGADTIIIAAASDFASGETINGTVEQGTIDTLRLDDAATYTLTGVTNIDSLVLSDNNNGFNVTVADAMVATANFNQDATGGDLGISSDTLMGNGVTINASGLTGVNRIVVDGTNLNGNDTITGGAGADTISAGSGGDTITGGGGADTLNGGSGGDTYLFAAGDVVSGESIADTGASGTDTISVSGSNDFTVATVSGIEALTFTAAATTTFNSNQLPTNSGGYRLCGNQQHHCQYEVAGRHFHDCGLVVCVLDGRHRHDHHQWHEQRRHDYRQRQGTRSSAAWALTSSTAGVARTLLPAVPGRTRSSFPRSAISLPARRSTEQPSKARPTRCGSTMRPPTPSPV